MRLIVEPAMRDWAPRRPARFDPAALATLVNPASPPRVLWRSGDASSVIATGHQPWLWHPGVLAKDLAASRVAQERGARWFHVVVDHDVEDPLRLELPVCRAGRLEVETLSLAPRDPALRGCERGPVAPQGFVAPRRQARERLGRPLCGDVEPLIQAFSKPGTHRD